MPQPQLRRQARRSALRWKQSVRRRVYVRGGRARADCTTWKKVEWSKVEQAGALRLLHYHPLITGVGWGGAEQSESPKSRWSKIVSPCVPTSTNLRIRLGEPA